MPWLVVAIVLLGVAMIHMMFRRNNASAPASVDAPAAISGLKLWLKPESLSALSNGDPVSTWEDSSGNGNNLSQTGAARPTYQTSVLNGKAVVRSSGSQYLAAADATNLAYSQVSVFVVGKFTNPGAGYRTVASKEQAYGFFKASGSEYLQSYSWGAPSGDKISTWDFVDSSFHILGLTFDSGAANGSQLWGDGESKLTFTATVQSQTIAFEIFAQAGAQLIAAGDIAEVVVYNRVLTTDEIATLNAYWVAKYGL